LTRLGCDRVCLGLAGLPSLIPKLRASHESSPRVFRTLTLQTLNYAASRNVIESGLRDAEKKNGVKTEIEGGAVEMIIHLSEGYPHFLQQFAFSAFDHHKNDIIREDDVLGGAFKDNGALDQLGKRYFSELYFDKISSPDYRTVLN